MSENKSFFQTLPGILTGLAAVISAVTGLYLALNNAPPDDPPNDRPEQKAIELSIDSFELDPMPPTQNSPVVVTAYVRNSGNYGAENVLVKWWPGVNFPNPLTQTIPLIGQGEVKSVLFNYPGYRSWYGQIETKVVVNPNRSVIEQNYENNTLKKKIPVWKSRN